MLINSEIADSKWLDMARSDVLCVVQIHTESIYGLSASCMFDVGIKESAKVGAPPKRNAQKQGWLAMCTAIQLGNDTQKAVIRLAE